MIFIIKSVDSMSPALSKTFNWIFIEIEFYKHIDLQKNRNDIKFLSDELYGKERYRLIRNKVFCLLQINVCSFISASSAYQKKDIYIS